MTTKQTITKTTKTLSNLIRLSLALATAGTLAACEDVPTPAPKTRPPVTEAQPTPPAPQPAPAPPAATPEVKAEPVIVTPAPDDDKPVDTLTAARKMLTGGEGEKALELAKVATLKMPKRSAAWNVRGRAELRVGKRKDAIASFEKAVELNPKNGFARNNLGLALIYDKQYEKAVDSLEEAVELEPVTAYMWNNLGMAYEQLDRLEEARDAYAKAATMESEHARDSLARLKGVESVIRTAKAEPEPKLAPDTTDVAPDTKVKDTPTVTQ
jgi:predicted negative regulator of RcsB-dependent stress response